MRLRTRPAHIPPARHARQWGERLERFSPCDRDVLQCQWSIVPGHGSLVPILAHGEHLNEGWLRARFPALPGVAELVERQSRRNNDLLEW